MKRPANWLVALTILSLLLVAAIGAMLPSRTAQSPGDPPAQRRALARTEDAGPSPSPSQPSATASSTATTISTSTAAATPLPIVTPTPTAMASPSPQPLDEGTIACQPPPANDYASCRFTEKTSELTMTFYLWVPANYDPTQKYPLVLLLHGGGEKAVASKTPAQNRKVLLSDPYAQVWGPGFPFPDSVDVQQKWPSFIVVPQVEAPGDFVGVSASHGSYTLAQQPTDALRMTKEIVDMLQVDYRGIDAGRLYVTGLSSGGYGTWEMIERWPDYFAAAGPMCGAGDPSKADLIVNVPIWAFHASNDNIVPSSGSRDMIQAIRALGGNPRYTELQGTDHGIWRYAYAILGKPTPTPGFFDWLYSQRRSTPATP